MSETGATPAQTENSRTTWVIAIVAVIAVAAVVGWWLFVGGTNAASAEPSPTPTPSVTPSATPSPSPSASPSATPSPSPSATVAPASLEDVNGRWCFSGDVEVEYECVVVTLPEVAFEGSEFGPSVVYPPGADIDAEPSTYDYSVPPNSGGCWFGSIDGWPATSGAPLMYCPAGAAPGPEWEGLAGPGDEDRFWPGFQEAADLPYLRADA